MEPNHTLLTIYLMPKLEYLHQKKLNLADELREILSSLEERQLAIKFMDSTKALILLRDLDRVYQLFNELAPTGLNLLPEQGRFNSIQSRLRKMASSLLKALGGPEALSDYRPAPPPVRERWWWYIHEIVAIRQQRLLRQIVIGAIIVLSTLGGLALAFNTILAPSPEVVARLKAENNAYAAIEAGDYREALALIEQGLATIPNDPGLLIFEGVIHEILGEKSEAGQNFDQARIILDDPFTFHLGRAQLWLRLNRPDKAEPDARAALVIDENSARAWLTLAQALDFQDRNFEAIPIYEKAGQLALENGDNEIVVMARLALSRIEGGP